MKIDLGQFRQSFLVESADHTAAMEAALLDLRSAPEDVELLNRIFRAAHSIKGGAGSFGFAGLARFTHSLENLLEQLRSMEMRVSAEVIEVLLRSVDVLEGLLTAEPDAPLPAHAMEIEARIASLTGEAASADGPDRRAAIGQEEEGEKDAAQPAGDRPAIGLYRVRFHPRRELFQSGTNPIVLLRNLAVLGTVSSCQLHTEELPPLRELNPEECYLSWMVEIVSDSVEAELREVFDFVAHLAEISISRLDRPAQAEGSTAATATAAPTMLESRAAATATERGAAPARPREPIRKAATGTESSLIRVPIDKVDRLIDLVGELVIAHVMTAQMVEDFEPSCLPRLREAVASMERNTRELHERVMAVRMLPVGTLFQRYTRTVHDIAQATGKQIHLEMEGEETEIDKSMLEMLGDPLTHLVRNAADHGIEAPELRTAVGKAAEGLIGLRAFHRSGRIVIEIADDGAGIDTGRVRQRAVERGLIAPDAQLSEEQLRLLIFEPGFSTRDEISDLSGRGVGLDVVRRNVQQLSGTVMVASEKGRGSTVTIELPLTLAILEGLLVRVSDRTLVLPLLSVIETVPLRDEQIVRLAERGEVVVIRQESIPLLRLARYLGLQPAMPGTGSSAGEEAEVRRLAVIVESGRRKVGLVVDELLGQQQVVVKSLERHLRRVDGLMGATILGDGRVAPIVDVGGIGALNLFSLETRDQVLGSSTCGPAGGGIPAESRS